MTPLDDVCAELATLIPRLAEALPRDNTTAGRSGNPAGSVPYNPDVMHAIETLTRHIPETTEWACNTIHQPWQPRPPLTCLVAIPRLGERMHNLGLATEEARLEHDAHWWLRTVKLALIIRLPDFPVPGGWCCPLHDEPMPLMVVGAERFLRPDGMPGELTHPGLIRCGLCGESWPYALWPHLGRMLHQARRALQEATA